jgi:hypothetical protein
VASSTCAFFRLLYLSDACTIVSHETSVDFLDGRANVSKSLAVDVFGFGAHASNSKHLAILDHALLELAKQDAKSYRGHKNQNQFPFGTTSAKLSLPAA